MLGLALGPGRSRPPKVAAGWRGRTLHWGMATGDGRMQATEGVVLRRLPAAEADWRLAIATPERGLVWATARGARKPTASLAGRVEPFALNRWLLAPSKGGKSWTVSEAEALARHPRLAANLDALSAALALAESALAFWGQDDPQPEAFAVLVAALQALDAPALGPDAAGEALAAGDLAFLQAFGFGPELHACVGCGLPVGPEAEAAEAVAWGLEAGGALCATCAPLAEGPRKRVPPPAWAWLRAAQAHGPQGPWPEVGDRVRIGCRKLVGQAVAFFAEKPLPAHAMFEGLPLA